MANRLFLPQAHCKISKGTRYVLSRHWSSFPSYFPVCSLNLLHRLPQAKLLTVPKTYFFTLPKIKLQKAFHWVKLWSSQAAFLLWNVREDVFPCLSWILDSVNVPWPFPFSILKAITSLLPLNILLSRSVTLPPSLSEGGILPWWRKNLCNPPIQAFISSKNIFTKQPEIVFPQIAWHPLVQSSYS